MLKDENEYARRAAVEVLNEIGDAKSVKYLLAAIKDDDWWVRSRAGDALGKIGGPKVIDAVLQLARDQDDDIRRAAIEILNQTKDERAVGHLIEATKDKDWWVSERAVDALAEIGSKRAAAAAARDAADHARPLAARGGARDRQARRSKARGAAAAASCRGPRRNSASRRCRRWHASATSAAPSMCGCSCRRRRRTRMRPIAERRQRGAEGTGGAPVPASTGGTMLLGSGTRARPAATAGRAARRRAGASGAHGRGASIKPMLRAGGAGARRPPKLDIRTLRNGDMIEGRYKYIERIGKGAFGTVLLMEDTVVDDRLILKFLNPNVSEDEEMMKRFVHELRYSRKITHHNVIRIYDFLQIQGNYAISMEYFPSHTLGAEIVNEKPVETKTRACSSASTCAPA